MPPRLPRITAVRLFFLPVQTRVPLKFGAETLTAVTCARVFLRVVDDQGKAAAGWGETPLSVQWVWPSSLPLAQRQETLQRFCRRLASAWMDFRKSGHPLELGYAFQEEVLPGVRADFNVTNSRGSRTGVAHQPGPAESSLAMPWLAALVCNSAFDIALHDAYGNLAGLPVYQTYNANFLGRDLAWFLQPATDGSVTFANRYPHDFLIAEPPRQLVAWHLVGGLDLLEPHELRGNDAVWDYERLVRVGRLAMAGGVEHLSADFNCTVQDPAYVNEILDQLRADQPRIWDLLLYVEQPFPYDLEVHRLDVRSVSARKPLFLDESAHDWRLVRLGRELGWTGVALKTCKTQTGAILSACWAKAHGLSLMVQDLTNPMLAQIPHALLAAHVGTILGVETNAMQFYPEASVPEAKVHPGLYTRREGKLDLSTIRAPGFGYRLEEIQRDLPAPACDLS